MLHFESSKWFIAVTFAGIIQSVSLDSTLIPHNMILTHKVIFKWKSNQIPKANELFENQINHENKVSILYPTRRRERMHSE